jgi:predicted metalloprotease with PDZ domain
MTPDAITYTLRFADAARHYVEVDATYPTGGQPRLELMMPVWTPGSYLIREFERHVEHVEVIDPPSGAVPAKTRKNRWAIDTNGAERVTVRYRVYGREMSVRTNWIEARYALLQGAATYLTPVSARHLPHQVTLEMPPGWTQAMSGLVQPSEGTYTFVAADFDTLVDSPIVAGEDLRAYGFSCSGTSHDLVNVNEGGSWDGARAVADVERIVAEHERFWGDLPYEKYLFINMITEAGGGLEHANSTVLMTTRWAMGTRDAYVAWLNLVSHEFFHVWNVKRLRPVALGPFDYEHENYTPSLWVSEGFTSYYGDLLVRRAGLTSDVEYLRGLSNDIRALETTPGRLVTPVTRSSYDAWIKHYRPDENTANTSISYYTKGQIIAVLLDARIRLATNGVRSLDDVMRLAYERHSGAEGFSDAQVRAAIVEIGGAGLTDVLERALDTTQPLDYQPLLDAYGLQFLPPDCRANRGWLGIRTKVDAGRLLVTEVQRDAPASIAGVNVDDEIIAIGEYRVRAEQWDRRLEHYPPTTQASLLVARRDQLMRIDVTFGQEPGDAWRLAPRVAATAAQVRARAAWLGSRP